MKLYEEKKQRLSSELLNRAEANEKIVLNKDTSNLFRARQKGINENKIDVKSFNNVIDVDSANLIAEVEGMTSYADLVEETLKSSCLPAVVPELKSITIGGAISGCGIESSSFRYGLVHETVQEMDVLLGDGRVLTCTPYNEYKDLFFAIPNTFGTLGYILKVKVKLIPIKKAVKITHKRFFDPQDFFDAIRSICQENRVDYVEGVIFDHNEMYVTTGEFIEEAPFVSDYKYRKIYYRSIQKVQIDYLTVSDYIWRWDTDWFWCSKVFGMQNPVLRLLLGKCMLGSSTYTKMMHFANRNPVITSAWNAFGSKKESVIQDAVIPIQEAARFYDFFRKEVGIKPIWICPYKSYSQETRYAFCPMDTKALYVDFGFWDRVETNGNDGFINRKIEDKVRELGGFKSLYSDSYYTEKEFWEMYDRKRYEELKAKYDPKGRLKGFYEKCVRNQ